MAVALAAGALLCAVAAPAASAQGPSVTVAILPQGVEPEDLEGIDGLSPGTMSAGLSDVSAIQTYLDIGQGNRVFTSLYDEGLPPLFGLDGDARRVPGWDVVRYRAETAPAEIVPGLLASTLREGGVPVSADSALASPALIAADREGRLVRTRSFACVESRCPGLAVVSASLSDLPGLAGRLRGDDLMIALERPPADERETLAIGIAGEGFGDGNLTSGTTRTGGFVASTDLAPTIIERAGLEVPDEMSGRAIEAEADLDFAAVQERAERMEVVSGRRKNVIVRNLMLWFAAAALVALLSRGRAARPAFAAFGLSFVYLPALLLAGAAAGTTELGERLIVGLGAPGLAIVTVALVPGWGAMAAACAVTVGAYAIDVIAGSPLTARSLLGPNPGLGVRFYGIGNELEAALAVMIPVGVGAALTVWGRSRGSPVSIRAAVIAFLGTAAALSLVFAAGRFGADVGAAIVFPAGAAAATVAIPGALRRRRLLPVLVAAPVGALAALFALDLALGGDAHLSRSVFEAGGSDELADVFERRLRLSAASFGRATGQDLFWFSVAAIVVAVIFRRRLLGWFDGYPLARAGYAGAAFAVLLGVVANDSGATFLTIGTIGLIGCVAFAYSQAPRPPRPPRPSDD